jgi:hypothetical protein
MARRRRTDQVRDWWSSRRTTLLRLAVVIMAVVATIWLSYQFWRLIWGSSPLWHTSPWGAIDLRMRHNEVHRWFGGMSVYPDLGDAVYPPASYAILWPLLGWLPVTPARWLWAVTSVAALVWLARLTVQESGADTRLERAFAALLPLSLYGAGATIGNGQLIVHLLPLLVTGLLLNSRGRPAWRRDLFTAALVLLALAKPSVAAPFLWILFIVPGRPRPTLLVAVGYGILTLSASLFQPSDPCSLLGDWAGRASEVAAQAGQTNVHMWLAALGREEWILPASLLVLAGLGLHVYRHRHSDLWLLLGVTAIVARLWTYHRWYDDLLLLLPMIALFRIAKRDRSPASGDVLAGGLVALTLLTTLAPGGLYLLPPPWKNLYVTGQVAVWIGVLVFLVYCARKERDLQQEASAE